MGHMGTYMVHVPLHVSGLILHEAFKTKFLGILYHKLSTFMVIRRSTGSFKCHFRIFEILDNFFIMVGHHVMMSKNTSFGQYLCYQLDFLLAFLVQITYN